MPTKLLINSEPLERVYSYKYLGIQLASDLSWSAHISTLCSKARQQLGMLYQKFYRYSDVDTLKQLQVAFIRPHLEYATAVWDPHLSKDILELESVQCFACRVCTKSWDVPYCDMLSTLNLPPLTERRKLLKMCHLYKIIHGFIDFPNAPLLNKPCTNYFTRYTLILSHSFNLRLTQTLFIFPFFLMLYQF